MWSWDCRRLLVARWTELASSGKTDLGSLLVAVPSLVLMWSLRCMAALSDRDCWFVVGQFTIVQYSLSLFLEKSLVRLKLLYLNFAIHSSSFELLEVCSRVNICTQCMQVLHVYFLIVILKVSVRNLHKCHIWPLQSFHTGYSRCLRFWLKLYIERMHCLYEGSIGIIPF